MKLSIRPLQSADLRFRRIAGRHQISSDGKHLIDGVAFGRPFLRRSDRPQIQIPPRKRLRLTYDHDDDQVVEFAQPQHGPLATVDPTPYENGDEAYDHNEQDTGFAINRDSRESLERELRELRDDVLPDEMYILNDSGTRQTQNSPKDADRSLNLNQPEGGLHRLTRSKKRQRGLGIRDEHGYRDELGELDPRERGDALPQQLGRKRLAKSGQRSVNGERSGIQAAKRARLSSAHSERPSRRSSNASIKSVHFEDKEPTVAESIQRIDDIEESDDEDFDPSANADSDSTGSNKENVMPETRDSPSSKVCDNHGYGCQTANFPFLQISPVSDSSSSTTPSESESESSRESSDTTSNVSSSTTSSSDLEGEGASEKNAKPSTTLNKSERGPSAVKEAKQVNLQIETRPVKPYQGMIATQKRNQRRRDHNKLLRLKANGTLHADANFQDYRKWKESLRHSCQENALEHIEPSTSEKLDQLTTFEAKKQALLNAVAAGGVDVTETPQEQRQSLTTRKSKPIIPLETGSVVANAELPVQAVGSSIDNDEGSKISKPRAKLDLASSRRLLFGSLGLRAPKNKHEENSLRAKLAEKIRPAKQTESGLGKREELNDSVDIAEEDGTWRNKLILKAVECCREGIELSTPPFPFVQRWDPQQKGNQSRNSGALGRSKSQSLTSKRYKGNDEHRVVSSGYWDQNDETSTPVSSAAQRTELHYTDEDQSQPRDHERERTDDYQGAIDDQLLRDSHGAYSKAPNETILPKDLPELPEDMTTCSMLAPEACVVGAIIAFKQLDMSQETNWQPKISDYRTAEVNSILGDGNLRVLLAQRDRPIKDKLYDNETGQRVYSKFEMPDYEDQEAENDGEFIELRYTELIEPKLIQAARYLTDTQSYISCQATVAHDTIPASTNRTEEPPIDQAQEVPSIALLGNEEGLSSIDTSHVKETPLDVVADSEEPIDANEELGKEISRLSKDGRSWSSAGSEVPQDLEDQPDKSLTNNHDHSTDHEPDNYLSPRFRGFSSSPLAEKDDTSRVSPTGHTNGTESNRPILPSGNTYNRDSAMFANGNQAHDSSSLQLEDDFEALDFQRPSDQSDPNSSERRASRFSHLRGGGSESNTSQKSYALDAVDSDSDFPSVEHVFSTARSFLKASFSEDEDVKPRPSQLSPPLDAGSQRSKHRPFDMPEALLSSDENDGLLPAGSSQPPMRSQIVDLTQSSDLVDPPDSEYEDRGVGLPTGPGWVKKTRSGRASVPTRSEAKRRKLRSF